MIATAQDAAATPPAAAAVMARAGGENFPVASRLLPRCERRHLLGIYGFARLVDELGDEAKGDRIAALAWLEGELEAAYEREAKHPLMRRLSETLAQRALPREPFLALIEANRVDQSVTRYETWEDLQGYCALSANPVGVLVLHIFGAATEERIALSDRICTALQLVEHCQDVAEDLANGRIYMPRQDMLACGCGEQDLQQAHAGPPVRSLIALELARVRDLLAAGAPLIDSLKGRPRLAVAAFLAGGFAAADAIERSGFEVLAGTPQASAWARIGALISTLAERRRAPHAERRRAQYAEHKRAQRERLR